MCLLTGQKPCFRYCTYNIKWSETFESWLKEAEWSRKRHAPPINEYLRVGAVSIAIQAMILPACFVIGPVLPWNSARYSKPIQLLMVTTRLLNDIQSYQVNYHHAIINSAYPISFYIHCTETIYIFNNIHVCVYIYVYSFRKNWKLGNSTWLCCT